MVTSGNLREYIYKCEKCGFKDTVEWGICVHNPITLSLTFNCKSCDTLIEFVVSFPQKKEDKLKMNIKKDERTYIG